jgi:quercetin dioxygenase-like cupin family protein
MRKLCTDRRFICTQKPETANLTLPSVVLPIFSGEDKHMASNQFAYTSLALSIILGSVLPVSAEEPPQGNKGFTASKTTVVELGSEIDGMAGRQLRMRMLTIAPGGYIGMHSHKNRPAVVYFMQGTDEVGLADGSKKVVHPGATSMATSSTTHYHRNIGKDDVVLIAVDIFTPKK